MEETERETTEETIYVYEYPASNQSDAGEDTKVITIESKDSPDEDVTTVTQYVEEVVEIDNENVVVANVMAASEKGSIKLVLAEEEDNPGEHGYTMNYRPIRPVERQKMRPWLLEHLDSGSIPGLSWQNRTQRIFRISWKHAAHNCFNRTTDSDLFERWAYHTGRHHDGNHKRWKANFRCALNSLPDVIELRDLGVRKGDNAFKVYKFIDLNDEKEREEKKRLQMVTRSSKKTDNKKGSSTPSTPAGSKQLKESGSPPAAFSITTTEGGMLQTLLHAIELKNQEAATDKDDDKKSKEKIQLTVKRSLDQENQPRSKRSRRETGKTPQSEETESSEEEGGYESESQGSSTSLTPGATPSTPTSGQSVLNMLKLPYILDMKQLLALAGNKQKDIEGKGQGQDKLTITNVTLDSVLQDRLTRNTDSSNVKITIPYTVFEALKAKNLATKNPGTLEGTPSSVVLTQALDNSKDTTETTAKPQPTVVSSSKEATAYPNIRSRLVSRLNISGAQVVGQGQIRPTLVTEGGRKSFEKVTVQAIPQLQPVNVGSSGEESDQGSKINISPVNINADVSQSETPGSSQANKESADMDHVTEQVTVELGELTEDQLSAEVMGGEPDNQFTADKRETRTVMTHCNLYLNAACPGCGLVREGLTPVIRTALDVLRSQQYHSLSYQIPVTPSLPLVITNRRYFGCLEEDLDPVTVTLTPEGQLNINVLFKILEKIAVKSERGELDVQAFQWTMDRLVGNVLCPGVSVTHYPDHWEVPVRQFEEPFRRVQSLTCPVWYSSEGSEEFPISMCGGCQDATDSLTSKQEETIETEIIVMDPDIAEQVFEGTCCNISHVEVSEEVTGQM